MNLVETIAQCGVNFATSKREARNILMSNRISMLLSTIPLLLIFLRIPVMGFQLAVSFGLILGSIVFFIPVALNKFGHHIASRFFLCWFPGIVVILLSIVTLYYTPTITTADYVGIRFYLLAFSIIPFLVFDLQNKGQLLTASLGLFILLLFFDQILNAFGVGYMTRDLSDQNYAMSGVRSGLAMILITGSALFLKSIIEKNEKLAEKLLIELEQKNKLLAERAADEVQQLNRQLMQNLEELSEREFFLRESQRIAKIGNWEYMIQGAALHWSEEMYNIFGLDKSFELSIANFSALFEESQSGLLIDATNMLLKYGKAYDITLRVRTPFGYYKWMRINASPIEGDNRVIGAKGICHDITIYRESEELLRNSESKYKSLFEQASDAIMIFDLDNNFIDVNASLCQMVGYSKEELLGMKVMDLVDREQLKESPLRYDKVSLGEQIFLERTIFHKNGKSINVEVNIKMYAQGRIMAISRDVTNRKQIEAEKERARYQLNERIKELTALYQTARILNEENTTTDEILSRLVLIIRAGWQFPEITEARIALPDREYKSPGYRESEYFQKAEILSESGKVSFLEVVYLEKRPTESEGPFLAEERDLINMIAEMVRIYIVRKREEIQLSNAQANLAATINNTEILIWSVDSNFNLLTFNKPFSNIIKQYFNGELEQGKRIADVITGPEADELTKRWEQYYMRALTGEIVTAEEKAFDKEVHFSLSPIIENSSVIGVSIFGNDVTERRTKERELNEANAKIGEMKLMALRSVMSPHFIFNVLNSIQFFIAKNDRINAINYLSSFSKLIRSIMSHSVSNKIRLSEELELLRNYVQLEMARFENKFDFILTVDPEVDVESIEIPSLLIQPYVENAILHGLYNKKEKGTLNIKVRELQDNVIFDIEDDGVGREEAMKIRKRNFPAHKSMGVKLTEERLRLINQSNEAALEIEDLHQDNLPIGTRVRIKVKPL
jgi:PAS domain S-box-containing protein